MDSVNSIENIDEREHMFDKPVPDRHRNPRQKWAIMTVVAQHGTNQKVQKDKDMLIRVYGCTETVEQANEWAQRIRDSNDFFDVYSLELHEWHTMPPSLDEVQDVKFTDQRVQQVRDNYIAHLKGQKADMAERLEDVQRIREKEKAEAAARKKELAGYFDANGERIPGTDLPEHLQSIADKAIAEKDFESETKDSTA